MMPADTALRGFLRADVRERMVLPEKYAREVGAAVSDKRDKKRDQHIIPTALKEPERDDRRQEVRDDETAEQRGGQLREREPVFRPVRQDGVAEQRGQQ